jgi:hypothetical protein
MQQMREEEYVPGEEEYLALLAVLGGGEVEVVYCVAALVGGQAVCEVAVSLAGPPEALHLDLHGLLVDLEHDEPEAPARLQLLELDLARVVHRQPGRRVRLKCSHPAHILFTS